MTTTLQSSRLYSTRNAAESLDPDDVMASLDRHFAGDWGDVPAEDKLANDAALAAGEGRLLSVFRDRRGTKFWVITEADHSVTTVLLPEDY